MKIFLLLLVITTIILCTAPVRNSSTILVPDSVENHHITLSTGSSDSASRPVQPPNDAIPQLLSPPEWIGKKFIILPKQKLLCAQGYSLTTCRDKNECDTMPVNPDWENSGHRILCSKIGGDSVYVDKVEPDSNEWLITFAHIPSEKRLFARTYKQAINEIAFSDDLTAARARWLNRIVFSKKGVISQLGTSATATISSKRIRIQDSLLVVNVRWGMTPLPVKPLWLMVKMNDNTEGFIPLRISWTNTMIDRRSDRQPWDEDIYETNPADLYKWDENMWEVVNNHRVILEMTTDQVTASWGYPLSIVPQPDDSTNGEIWTYPSHELRFQYNKLIAISERQ
ncbi:MAG: hypothetical protein JW863_08430 [Chitinispirillaceae bacterium]|nr:hypothetical protein [Chitinispirillaceae bacterium]